MSDTERLGHSVQHPDRRIARTMTAIVESFTELATAQPVATISVKALVERAGIGRSTFYDHFASVEQLLLWLVDALIDWSRDADGRMQLDVLLTFVAELREVTAAFLEMPTCANRCEVAMADALSCGDKAARTFAAAGAMGSLRVWLTDGGGQSVEELVGRTCALVTASIGVE